jgi:hypothetical protein
MINIHAHYKFILLCIFLAISFFAVDNVWIYVHETQHNRDCISLGGIPSINYSFMQYANAPCANVSHEKLPEYMRLASLIDNKENANDRIAIDLIVSSSFFLFIIFSGVWLYNSSKKKCGCDRSIFCWKHTLLFAFFVGLGTIGFFALLHFIF